MSLIFTKDFSGRSYGVTFADRRIGSITNYGNIVHGDIWTVCCEGMQRVSGTLEHCQQVIRDWVAKQMKEQAQVVTVAGFGRVTRQCPRNIRFAAHNANKATQSVKVERGGVETWVNHVPRAFTQRLKKGDQVEIYMDLAQWRLRPMSLEKSVVGCAYAVA